MPYISVKYAGSLESVVDVAMLLSSVHKAAVDSGLFSTAAIRSFAERHDYFIMGDGRPENGFVLIVLRIRKGRSEAVRSALSKKILEAAASQLERAFDGRSMALNVEVQEIDSVSVRQQAL